MLAIDDALLRLGRIDPDQQRMVEASGKLAKACLFRELGEKPVGSG